MSLDDKVDRRNLDANHLTHQMARKGMFFRVVKEAAEETSSDPFVINRSYVSDNMMDSYLFDVMCIRDETILRFVIMHLFLDLRSRAAEGDVIASDSATPLDKRLNRWTTDVVKSSQKGAPIELVQVEASNWSRVRASSADKYLITRMRAVCKRLAVRSLVTNSFKLVGSIMKMYLHPDVAVDDISRAACRIHAKKAFSVSVGDNTDDKMNKWYDQGTLDDTFSSFSVELNRVLNKTGYRMKDLDDISPRVFTDVLCDAFGAYSDSPESNAAFHFRSALFRHTSLGLVYGEASTVTPRLSPASSSEEDDYEDDEQISYCSIPLKSDTLSSACQEFEARWGRDVAVMDQTLNDRVRDAIVMPLRRSFSSNNIVVVQKPLEIRGGIKRLDDNKYIVRRISDTHVPLLKDAFGPDDSEYTEWVRSISIRQPPAAANKKWSDDVTAETVRLLWRTGISLFCDIVSSRASSLAEEENGVEECLAAWANRELYRLVHDDDTDEIECVF